MPAIVKTQRGSWGGNGTAWSTSTSTTKVSSSFTPSDESLLVVVFGGANDGGGDLAISTFSISDSASLTWTQRIALNTTYDGAVEEAVIIWTAPVTTGTSMTITITHSSSWSFNSTPEAMMQVFDFTNYNAASPIGVTGTASNTGDAAYNLTLSAAPRSNSVMLGAVFQSNGAAGNHTASPGSGCTEEYDSASTTFAHLQTQTRTSSTSSTLEWVDVNSGTAYNGTHSTAVAVEIKGEDIPVPLKALEYAHGAIRWLSTDAVNTTYTVSGLSFRPRAIRFFWTGIDSALINAASQTVSERRGIGFAGAIPPGASSRGCVGTFGLDAAGSMDTDSVCCNDAVAVTTSGAGAIDGRLDLSSIADDGFVLIVDDQAPASITVFWEAWGGPAITGLTIGYISEPAATGTQNYTADGFTSAENDTQVVMLAGVQSTAAVNTAAVSDSGLFVGCSTGSTAAQNILVLGNNDEGSAAADCDGYALDGECLAMITVAGGNPSARAVVSAFGTNQFTLNWTARATTNRNSIYMSVKGGKWRVGSYTINGNTLNATATVSGLPFKPLGVSLMGRMGTESVAGTAATQDRIGLGCGTSSTDRRAIAIWDEDATANQEINHVIRYDSVLAFPSSAGALASSYDINAMNNDGFQIIVDTAGGVASEWQGYLTFGTVSAPSFSRRTPIFFRRSA